MSTLPQFSTFIPPLPLGWTEHQAPGGQTYYYNASTNQSTYTRPLPGIPGVIPFMPQGAVIPGVAVSKEKKKKERPLNKTPVPGTPWLRVKTTEGNVFWTHKERKESVWEVPEEIKELVEDMERQEKEKEARDIEAKATQEIEEREREADEIQRKEREEVERVMVEVKDAVAAGKRKAAGPVEGDENGEHKKPRVEEELEEEESDDRPDDEQWQRKMAEEMMAEAGAHGMTQQNQDVNDPDHSLPSDETDTRQDSAAPTDHNYSQPSFKVPDRVDLSIDEAKALFKTLLQEKNVNPIYPWDTSLPLFITDPRYVLLPSVSARREAFDEYCRDAARAQRAAKAATLKKESERASMTERDRDKEAYLTLLKEEVTSTRATWHEFRRKWKKDRRFFGWAGEREKERAFRDWLRDLADVKKKQAEKAEREFFQLLREHEEIKPGDIWKEVKRMINSKDPRYDAVGSSSLREELFSTYIKTVGDSPIQAEKQEGSTQGEAQEQDDDATRRKQRAERAERGLREREEKVRRERAGLERELGRTRGVVVREEGEREFMMLLTDAVRDPQADWDTTAPSLSKDPRFVLCALPLSVQRDLFSKHVARLREKHLAGLHALFAAHASLLSTRWHDLDESARHAIRGSTAVGKLGLSDHDLDPDLDDRTALHGGNDALEAEFERWQRTRNNDARQAFDAMLNENSFLEFWGRMGKVSGDGVGAAASVPDEEDEEEGECGGGRADLKKLALAIDKGEIEKVLKNDSRWTAFDHVREQRERWLRDYMEKLAAPKLSVHVPDKGRT